MSSILIPISVIVGLILVVGLMSLSESALVTARRRRLREQAARGDRGAAAALGLSEHLERFVSTVRVGATVAWTLAGVCAGIWVREFLGPARGDTVILWEVAVGTVVAGITVATMLLGELLPRKIALHRPERIACWIARPMAIFAMMASPLARGLEGATELLARLLGVQSAARPPITPEEIKGLLWEGTKAGVFEESEHEIFKRVFRFCERRGRALMTPRDKVVWLDVGDSSDEIRRKVGLLTLNDILEAVLGELPEGNGEDEPPRSVRRPDGSWLLHGRFPLDEFRDLFDLAELPDGDYDTLAGLVVTQLGHIPRVSESFDLHGLRFEVVDMDAQRVDRVLVSPLAGEKAAG
jgi:CBS domain containing-hemolysin-like protein